MQGVGKSTECTLLRWKTCQNALSQCAAGARNHRKPLFSLLILQFRDSPESGKSILACFSFRIPCPGRNTKTETREDRLPAFREITELQCEQAKHRGSCNSGVPRRATKVQNVTPFHDQKCAEMHIPRFPGTRKVQNTRFPLEKVLSCAMKSTFGSRNGTHI